MRYKLLRTSLISTPFPRLNYWKTIPFIEGRIYLSLEPLARTPPLLTCPISSPILEFQHGAFASKNIHAPEENGCTAGYEREKISTSGCHFWRPGSQRSRFKVPNKDDDGDDEENVKKAIGLMSTTTTRHLHHAFLFISLLSLHNYDVKWPNVKFTWEREGRGNKFYHLCLNSCAVPSLQVQPKFPSFK